MHGTEAIDMLNKAKIKDQLKKQIDQFKHEPAQQGLVESDSSLRTNPLYESTFLRSQNRQEVVIKQEEDSKPKEYFRLKFKKHITKKAFIGILALIAIWWLWKGGYKKFKDFRITRFILLHVFGVK